MRTFVLAFVSNEILPKRRVLIKTGSQRCRRLLAMFFMVLRRVCLSVIYMGEWRRKCAVQYPNHNYRMGFKSLWKLCLSLCSHKWLKPSRSLVINLIPLRLWQLKSLLADGLINFRTPFLNILKLLEFLMLWSNLFHSVTADGKKVFLKKVCLVLGRRILWIFLVT